MGVMPQVFEERPMGDLTLWAPPGLENARSLTSAEKIALDKKNTLLAEQAQTKSSQCWIDGCPHKPRTWVREVQFDMKGDKAAAGDFAQVSSEDYVGPVPGFCLGHIGSAPAQLAQVVYFSRPEMQWGLRPKRWFVIFTDDTKQGGECIALDPTQESPIIKEEWIPFEGES